MAQDMQHAVNHIAVKLPPFWPGHVAAWFAQAEASFEISGIKTEDTKYSYVLSILPERTAADIEDILTNPPKENKYEFLKSELIRRLSCSEEKRLNQLLNDEELGDRSPSQFLRHLRSLAGPTLQNETILRQLWLRRLPQTVQAILAAQADLPLSKVAELADRILEVAPTQSFPPAICSTSTPMSTDAALLAITRRLDELTLHVAALDGGRSSRSRDRSYSRMSTRSKSRGFSQTDICWYHRRFKEKATRCTTPCSWKMQPMGNSPGGQ
ncbi:hypothetical protein PYW08_009460 [Mythimna loreyi]|uniref:Uncharacterized protein n=1 Tax=Mythimna loreyi TaxID=667449 RepID=A0ACC2Q7T2_9NEOP|nr:hypothetical protein PYW08_009460 [Mythimna loreyi]